jgi:hypothetical protein
MKIIINLGREILLLGSVRESIMKPSETSSGKNNLLPTIQFLYPQDDFIFQQDGAACHTAKTS